MKKLLILFFVFLLTISIASALEYSTAYDDFECNGFNCGSGWIDTWTYTGGCEITTLSNPIGIYQLRGQSGCDVSRTVNTSSANVGLNVSFYAGASGLEDGEWCLYSYYTGSSYESLLNLTNGDDDTTLRYYSYEMVGKGTASNSELRMVATGGNGDYCLLDNVNITSFAVSPPNIEITSDTLHCGKKCNFDIKITDELNRTFTVDKYEWFLYLPYLQIPFLKQDYPMSFASSDTGYTSPITVDMQEEFGKNNYPRNELWITFNDGQGSYLKKSNIFSLELAGQPTMDVFGTEYRQEEKATVFLQLKDTQGFPVNDGSCFFNMYYPISINTTHTPYLTNAPMLFLDGSAGMYYYDITTLPPISGVYMLSASCSYSTGNQFVYYTDGTDADYPTRTPITGTFSSSPIVINAYTDFLYTSCLATGGAQKYCVADYDFDTSLKVQNYSAITDLHVFFMGEASTNAKASFQMYNWTSDTWLQLNNNLTFSGLASAGPTGLNDFVANEVPVEGMIHPNGTIKIKVTSQAGTTYNQYVNWLNIEIISAYGSVTDLKGSGEIHINDWFFNYTELISEAVWKWNATNGRTLTDIGQNWIGGTEYAPDETTGRIVARVMDQANNPVNGATCNASIFYPTNASIYQSLIMDAGASNQTEGVYYVDFNQSGLPGVHAYAIDCWKAGQEYFLLGAYHVLGTVDANIGNASITANVSNVSSYLTNEAIESLTRALTNETNELFIGGTDYYTGADGDISVRLIRGTAAYATLETNATCYASALYPNGTTYIDNQTMTEQGFGVYRYGFTIPDTVGVYTYYTDCFKSDFYYYGMNTFTVKKEGTITYIGGTEYGYDDNGKVAIRLFREQTQTPDTGASCLVSILNPDQSTFVGNASMTEQGFGIYYYDFTVPSTAGVYTYYTDCTISNRVYDGLSTFHVSDFYYNVTTDISTLIEKAIANYNFLTSLSEDVLKQAQFTEEQIYLITDATTSMQKIVEDIQEGKITKEEGDLKLQQIKENLLSNDAFITPNELYLDVMDNSCVAYIKNEGSIIGTYDVTMTIEGHLSNKYNIKLNPGETTKLGIDLSSLKTGDYYCSALSLYNGGKSEAKIKLNWDKEANKGIKSSSLPKWTTTIGMFIALMYIVVVSLPKKREDEEEPEINNRRRKDGI